MVVTSTLPRTWEDMLAASKNLFGEMNQILTNKESTQEERNRVPAMLADAQDLKSRAVSLKEIFEAGIGPDAIKEIERKQGPRSLAPANFKRWGEFLFETWKAGNPNFKVAPDSRLVYFRDNEERMGTAETKDMSGASGAGGGFLIPAEFQAQLQAAVAERSIVRQRATIIPMRRRQIDIPVVDQTGTTSGQPHWFGGMRFYWAEEASAKTETDAAFKQASLVAHKLIGYTRVSDELVDDSAISLEAFFSGPFGFAGGVAWMEDYGFLRGTGAGQPLGVIDAGCTIIVPRAAVNAVAFTDLAHMLEHALPGGRFVWVISQSLLSEFIQMSGPAGNASYVWIPNARDGVPGTLFGYPVVWSEKPPAIGSKGDVGLYDFSYYVIGDRQATTVESTKYDRWSYDQTSWRVVHRVDGQPWLSDWLTLQDGATTVSPFVVLGAGSGS